MSTRLKVARTKYRPSGRDYGYQNARIRGMRARLLKEAFFDDLMSSKDISAMIGKIMDTEYAPDLENRILHGRTANQIDEALKDNMTSTFRKVLSFSNDEAQRLITTLLGRWDLFNVKTIIRGIHMQASAEEITESLITVGQLTQADTNELVRQPSIRALVDTLSMWGLPLAVPLREVLPAYEEGLDLSHLELALDRYYYQWAASRLKGGRQNSKIAGKFLSTQVDTMNLLTAIRLLQSDLDEQDTERFFLPGGGIVTKSLFIELAGMSDIDEVFNRIKKTPYGKPLDQVALTYIEKGSVSVFERALEDYLFRFAFAQSKGDPLDIGLTISYLWMKANEVTNLRIIVKGVSVGMPQDPMREELILV